MIETDRRRIIVAMLVESYMKTFLPFLDGHTNFCSFTSVVVSQKNCNIVEILSFPLFSSDYQNSSCRKA